MENLPARQVVSGLCRCCGDRCSTGEGSGGALLRQPLGADFSMGMSEFRWDIYEFRWGISGELR